jgi:uncharacterized protein (DUF58 family)
VAAYRRIPARRGLDQHVGFRIATRFPFGFFEKSRELNRSGDLVIYPAVDTIALPRPQVGVNHFSEGSSMRRGSGDEILGLRSMRDGDDPRDIYWKRSAFGGPKVVLERATEVQSRAYLQLDNAFEGEQPRSERQQLFERQVRDVASNAVAHMRRGEPVTVTTTSGAVSMGHPAEGADALLRFLALIELSNDPSGGARQALAHVHLAREGVRPQKVKPSLVMAPVQLSRPADASEVSRHGPGSAQDAPPPPREPRRRGDA